VIATSKHQTRAAEFIAPLLAPEGRAVLSRLGFQPAPAGAR
jgi:ABC-type molybdate transport system substrate-binding protein